MKKYIIKKMFIEKNKHKCTCKFLRNPANLYPLKNPYPHAYS
ncbi:hypothetical protein EUBDOL_00454 [Amedibacillus dolichus DSM 3991]|uniref:Uncharacterized protein n=1 Tax=Amedibacillus dolichus DSM 3991 TaxID=428127 RepID=A8R916_9FIRM|nr:hypothetical protein EUBDOL_00454 [Amedibacillus dolichus DSM 3991]